MPIQVAILVERLEHARLLFQHGARPNVPVDSNMRQRLRPYHDCEYHERVREIHSGRRTLLDYSFHFRDGKGPDACRLLLENGEDPNQGDTTEFCTPINGLCAGHCWVYAEMLILAGAKVTGRDPNGYSAMYWAANCDNVPLIFLLLEKGADINVRTNEGETPLHTAAMYDCLEAGRALVERGADVEVKDEAGLTALQYAQHRGHIHFIEIIEAAINARAST